MAPVRLFLVFILSLSLSTAFVAPPPQTLYRTCTAQNAFSEAKEKLLDIIDNGRLSGDQSNIFIDPVDGGELVLKTSVFGFVTNQVYSPKGADRAYKVGPFVDLVAPEEKPLNQMTPRELIGQSFFQTPVISAIYERGYRQNFATAGFPGVDKEFEEANAYFMDSSFGSDTTLLDLSCGSGFMTRKFIKSDNYKRILSGDLSPTMLGETRARIAKEGLKMPELFRADSARLPLKTESVNFIHCGAAFHCYPNLSDSLSEIYRVLKTDGRLFANEEELIGLLVAAGFPREGVVVRREGRACAIIKAQK